MKQNVKIGAGIFAVVLVLGIGIYLANRPLALTSYPAVTASVKEKKLTPSAASSKMDPSFKPATVSGAGPKSNKKDAAPKIIAPGSDVVRHGVNAPEIEPWPEEPQPLVADDAQLEMDYVVTKMYEQEARTELPLLSVQTHNPFKDANGHYVDSSGNTTTETPEAVALGEFDDISEFGNLNPPDGEIWIRIDPEHAREANEIMAQAADLYRSETGYQNEVKVMLWVGGRPYRQHSYVN